MINNAAIVQDSAPPSQLDIAILRRTYETNVFGVFAVTKAMLPLLRKSEAGRIVNMSSGAGSLTETSSPDWRAEWNTLAYNSSKAAVNSMTVHFATELRSTPIKVNAVNPGYTGRAFSGWRVMLWHVNTASSQPIPTSRSHPTDGHPGFPPNIAIAPRGW